LDTFHSNLRPVTHTKRLSDPTGQRPPLQFILLVVAQSVVFAWVYNGTRGSVLLVILMHGSANTVARLIGPTLIGSAAYGLWWWSLAALWWVVALGVITVIAMARDRAPSMESPTMASASARVR
jgi:hypothetical protein